MTTKIRPLALAAAIALALHSAPSLANPPLERPRLENYRDYSQFLVDMSAYRKRQREAEAAAQQAASQPARSSGLTEGNRLAALSPAPQPPVQPPEPIMPAIDLESEEAPPPLVVSGPEDLEQAVEQAKSFAHPQYSTARRYNRSTSNSFPLAPLEGSAMQSSAISNMWPGSTPLPQTVAHIDRALLDEHANRVESAEDQLKRINAAQKADADEKKRREQEQLDKAEGINPRQTLPFIETVYFPGIQGPSGGAFDITIRRSEVTATFHD